MKGLSAIACLLWSKILWRHWRRAPRPSAALLLTVAIGVAVFFSVRLANRSALAAFKLFTETITGESELIVSPQAGHLPSGILPQLRHATADLPAIFFPILETTASEPAAGGANDGFMARQYQVIGTDLPSLANLVYLTEQYQPLERNLVGRQSGNRLESELENLPGAFIPPALAEANGWTPGQIIHLLWNESLQPVQVAGILPASNFQIRPPDNLLLMELTDVQALSGRTGTLDRVEIRIPPGFYYDRWLNEIQVRLQEASEGRWIVTAPDQLRADGRALTRAFRLNLTVLSGLALLVGIYLVLHALEASVVQRRLEIGILRSLGVEPRQIRAAWLSEAALLGAAGSVLGLLIGFAGAQLAVRAVARTINSLYYSTTVSAARWDWFEAGLALAMGLACSLVAGWLPARDAAQTPPAQVLQRGYRGGGGVRWLSRYPLGAILVLTGLACYFLPPLELAGRTYFPIAGYAAALFWVTGGSILAGLAFSQVKRSKQRLFARSPVALLAAGQLSKPTSRHRLAVAGLVTAFAMAAGMAILIASFERTMEAWIHQALRADLYIAPQGVGNVSSQNRIMPSTWRRLEADPAVRELEVGQMFPVKLDQATTYLVGAGRDGAGGWKHVVWLSRPPDRSLTSVKGLFPAWVNESFANRFGKKPGDHIVVPTPQGPKRLEIDAVYADYGNELGSILVDRAYLADWFDDRRAFSLGAYLKEGVDASRVRDRWQAAFPGLVIRMNQTLRAEVMRVFHQTFAVTYVLKWIGIFVAVTGAALALASLIVERRREFATLQELGMGRRQVASSVALEGAGLALIGVVAGAALSVALGHLLIYVINKQSFGWTLAFRVPWLEMALSGLAVIVVSGLVAWRIGWWAAGLRIDREE